jgi:hypothetical protein
VDNDSAGLNVAIVEPGGQEGPNMRHRQLSVLSLVAAALLSVAAAAPTQAANAYRPDVRIKIDCKGVVEWRMCPDTWTGEGVYNKTANNQRVVWEDFMDYASEPDPRVMYFKISILNAGTKADRFLVEANGVTNGYKVKFLRGSKDITSAVESATYMTPRIAPGGKFLIRAKVAMPCKQNTVTYCGQDLANRLVTVSSYTAPAVVDSAKFVRRLWVCTC